MTSNLSNFAARLREFISHCASDPSFGVSPSGGPEADSSSCSHDERTFNTLALELFGLQFDHNPAYRKFCVARKVSPGSVTQWTRIPAVPAAAFKELELTCLPATERTTVFYSSGTTGQRPSRHFHSSESLAVYAASVLPWFCAHVASRIADRQLPIAKPSAIGDELSAIILTPAVAQAPHSSLVHMFEVVRRNLNWPESVFVGRISDDGSWSLSCDAALEALRQAERGGRPAILLGTAFSFVHLLELLADRDLRFKLPPGSRAMETGGYKGRSRSLPKAELHALIVERLAIPASHIVSEYGMSELSSQAYDCEVRSAKCEVRSHESEGQGKARIFRLPPWARCQIISPETSRVAANGETGLLRVFDLANVFSVMAIQTEDLAIRRGDGFELIGRAETAEPRGCSLASLAIADSQSPIANSR